jgi:chemotaxis response regulator CheB
VTQNEKSSVVFGVPMEALKLGAAEQVLPLNEVAGTLTKFPQMPNKQQSGK